jgi:hypothetical protein
LGRYLENGGFLPPNQYGFRRGLGTCDALLHVTHLLQRALDSGHEARLVQLDFSAAFDSVNHLGLLHKLRSVGVGGSVLSIIENFLSGRRQCVLVDGCPSTSFCDVVSGVPQGSVLGPLLFILYTADLFSVVDNVLVGYADDATLISLAESPGRRSVATDSLQRDLCTIDQWCHTWGMKLNAGKSKTMVVSRSRTQFPSFLPLVLNGAILEELRSLKILGIEFDSKLTFESHLRAVASGASQRIGLLRRAWKIFSSVDLLRKCFNCFVLPLLEYGSPVWLSAAMCHLALLERIVGRVVALLGEDLCDLFHRRRVASLCMLFKVYFRESHPLREYLPAHFIRERLTRRTGALHSFAFDPVRSRTSQFARSFVPRCVEWWNQLDGSAFEEYGIGNFKAVVNHFHFSD